MGKLIITLGLGLTFLVGCQKQVAEPEAEAEATAQAEEAAQPEEQQPAEETDFTALAQEFGTTMCNKTAECAEKALAKLPKKARRKAKKNMPNKKECLANVTKQDAEQGEGHKLVLTQSEQDMLNKCLEELKTASCEQMGKMPDCEAAGKMLEAKGKGEAT